MFTYCGVVFQTFNLVVDFILLLPLVILLFRRLFILAFTSFLFALVVFWWQGPVRVDSFITLSFMAFCLVALGARSRLWPWIGNWFRFRIRFGICLDWSSRCMQWVWKLLNHSLGTSLSWHVRLWVGFLGPGFVCLIRFWPVLPIYICIEWPKQKVLMVNLVSEVFISQRYKVLISSSSTFW